MSQFTCPVVTVQAVRPLGDNLSVVTVQGHEVVANRREDGEFRWQVGEPVVYVPENAVVPEDVLKARGYWDLEKNKGLLEGKRGNRVKMRRFAGFESRGLLFKVTRLAVSPSVPTGLAVDRTVLRDGGYLHTAQPVALGEDVAGFLGITEHGT